MSSTFIIGIISYFPDDIWEERKTRFEAFLSQTQELFANIPIVIIAQNWKDFIPKNQKSIFIYHFPKLGIVGARRKLNDILLDFDFTFAILLDDDAIYYGNNSYDFLAAFENKTSGYCFRNCHDHERLIANRYMPAALNLCVISKDLLQLNPIDTRFDPQKSIAYEDVVWPLSFYCLYPDKEIRYPIGTLFTSFQQGQNITSTWYNENKIKAQTLWDNTKDIVIYMYKNKVIPNFKLDQNGRVIFIEKDL